MAARFGLPQVTGSLKSVARWLGKNAREKSCKARARIFCFSATVYFIWHARNARLFDGKVIADTMLAQMIIAHVYILLHSLHSWDEVMTIAP